MSKLIIYQVLPRLFGNNNKTNKPHGSIKDNGSGKFNDFTDKALKAIKTLGSTHIWYTGVIEHATQTDYSAHGIRKDHPVVVKGKAGSPYAIKDYYDVDPDLAVDIEQRMEEFEALIARTHKAGLKAVIDFVPNHVARAYYSDKKPKGVQDLGEGDAKDKNFAQNNNFYYLPYQQFQPSFDIHDYQEYPTKVTGNDQFTASPSRNDWYETVKLNYGVDYLNNHQQHFDPIPDTWNKMLHILLYWASKKIDGFRCDMAEMVPVAFWQWVIAKVKEQYPNVIFIAEIYNTNEYRNYIFTGGFDYLYDKVGMYDLLKDIVCHQQAASQITQAWQSLSGIEDKMLHFLENHDEQRIASDFFAADPWKAIPALIVSASLTTAPFMLYAGQELGELGMDTEGFSGLDGRTTIFDYWGVKSLQDWSNNGKFDGKNLRKDQQKLRKLYQQIMQLCTKEAAIAKGKMYDLQYANFDNADYNTHRQFAYFRQYEKDLLLIIVNFDDNPVDIKVNIPTEALEYLQIEKHTTYKAQDLLDLKRVFDWDLKSYISVDIPAFSGRIIKLKTNA